MCGFVGLINTPGNTIDSKLLKDLASLINYRGPDDEGCYIDNNVGFYHKRLSIIDLKSGHQPMEDSNAIIVFNGEIYNYLELRNELIKKGVNFKTTSDTEVILKMYLEYGKEFVTKLNGMFAFLIYDKKKKRILAVRDHFGIKPLYFFKNENIFLFASEIKAIVAHPDVPVEPNYSAISEYLTFQYVIGKSTLFKNIFKLLPGHYLEIDVSSGNYIDTKYWEPSFKIDNYHTEEYFIDSLKELIEDSIKIQLRSDVPLGAYLSGGFDSSLVSIIASKNTGNKFKTFTGAFNEGDEFNETKYAREVAQFCGAELYEIYPTVNDFTDLLPKIIYHLDEPTAGPGVFPQFMVSKLAAENVKVVLGGQGGDEIFGGYARYVVAYLEQALKGAIFDSNEEGEHIVSLQSILPNLPYLQNYVPMLKEFLNHGAFEPMDRRYFNLIDRLTDKANQFFTEEFLKKYNKEIIFQEFQKSFNHPDTLSYFNKMTHFDLSSSLPALLQVEDRVSMAASIESRVPLLDYRIVNLVSHMPASMKFRGGEMKYILKKAVGNYLPKTIRERKDKMGFPVPLHHWAKNGANDFFKDIMLSDASKNRGIFCTKKLSELINSERPFGRHLWGAVNLELWFHQFIDNAYKIKKGKYDITSSPTQHRQLAS